MKRQVMTKMEVRYEQVNVVVEVVKYLRLQQVNVLVISQGQQGTKVSTSVGVHCSP